MYSILLLTRSARLGNTPRKLSSSFMGPRLPQLTVRGVIMYDFVFLLLYLFVDEKGTFEIILY